MTRPLLPPARILTGTAIGLTLILTGCASDAATDAADDTSGEASANASSAVAAGSSAGASVAASSQTDGGTYPVTVENCGREVTFEEAPQRIVTGWITATELLVELGAQDAIVGLYNTSSFGASREEYRAAYDALPVLSEAAPSREQLLAAEPDLIYADGNYLFDGEQLPTVDELEAAGIDVLVLSGFCDDGGASEVLDVQADLAAVGPALGLTEQSEALADDVDDRLAAVEMTSEVPLAMISVFDGTVYVYEGVYSDIAARAGATNIYAGTLAEGTYFGELSVEDLTQRSPETLVYLLSGQETPDQARSYLQTTFPTVAAVQQERVIYLPAEDSSNLRAVDAVEQLAEELASLG